MPTRTKYDAEKSEVDNWLSGNIGGPIMAVILVGIVVVFVLLAFGVHV